MNPPSRPSLLGISVSKIASILIMTVLLVPSAVFFPTHALPIRAASADNCPTTGCPGSISGVVFYDSDGSGMIQNPATEPGFSGWMVILEDSAGTVLTTSTTDSSGAYSFSGLSPGTYQVYESFPPSGYTGCGASYPSVIPPCWEETFPAASAKGSEGYSRITVTSGQDSPKNDFGNAYFFASSGNMDDSIGYWTSKNGQALLSSSDAAFLDGESPFAGFTAYPNEPATAFSCTAPGGPLHVTPFCQSSTSTFGAQLMSFLGSANSRNSQYTLAAMLAEFQLDVRHGFMPSSDAINVGTAAPNYAGMPTDQCTGPLSVVTIRQMTNCALAAWNLGAGISKTFSGVKGVQVFWATLLDDINSGVNSGEGSALNISSPVTTPLDSSNLPLPPSNPGCYSYNTSTEAWQVITCVSPQSVLQNGRLPRANLGIESATPLHGGASPISSALVQINIGSYQGSSDSLSGQGAYSIQLNTNLFMGTSNNPSGDTDWVQFVYQDEVPNCGSSSGQSASFCASENRFCIFNIDITTKNYNPTVCLSPGDIKLGSGYAASIHGFVDGQNLDSEAFFPGENPLAIVGADIYGLSAAWKDVSGDLLGAGGGSVLQDCNTCITNWVTSVGAASASAMSGTQVNPQITAESNNFAAYEENPILTSFAESTHWWLTSSTCSLEYLAYFGLSASECPNSGAAILGSGGVAFNLAPMSPASGTAEVGGAVGSLISLMSLDGVRSDISLSLTGVPSGVTYGPTDCLFGGPESSQPGSWQPGSTCTVTFSIQASIAASPGKYTLTLTANAPGALAVQTTKFDLTLVLVPPNPVIILPTSGGQYGEGQSVLLVGYAGTTDPGSIGFLPCSQLQFAWTAPDGTKGVTSTTPDPIIPYECDSSLMFSSLGSASVTLSATDTQGTGTSSVVGFTIVSQQNAPFSFRIDAPSMVLLENPPNSISFGIQVTLLSGTAQPVQLGVTGLPSDVTASFSTNPVTPSGMTTLTITAPSITDDGSYTVTISGTPTEGGQAVSTTMIVQIESVH